MNPLPNEPPPGSADHRIRAVLAGHNADERTARDLLSDPAGAVRASALGALERMGRLEPFDVETGLADGDTLVRRRAALIASRSREVPVASIARLLGDPDDRVVEAACFACGEREDATPDVVEALGQLALGHTDSMCREAAVAALGSLGRPESLSVVVAACADRATVRRRAVLALATFQDPSALDKLREMTTDRDLQVRQAAEELAAIADGGEW